MLDYIKKILKCKKTFLNIFCFFIKLWNNLILLIKYIKIQYDKYLKMKHANMN